MVHGILQFTPSIAFRYVLHRCESRDIRCRESFVFTEEARVPPTHAADGARGAGCRFEHSLALSAPGFVGRPPRAPGRARRGRGGGARAECRSTPPARAPRLLNAFAGSFCCAGFDNDPSAGSPTETLLRLLLPLNDKVQWTSRDVAGSEPPTSPRSEHFTGSFNRTWWDFSRTNARTSFGDGRQGGWIGWGGTNRSDKGLNLSGSWQQGHSATYNTPSHIKVVCKGFCRPLDGNCTSRRPPRPFRRGDLANDTCPWGSRTLLRVGKWTVGTCIASSPDFDLEAFSNNPAHAHVPYWWVNNPTLGEFCFIMIGRADIEGSKNNVAMNAWLPQASYPCGNFSGTSIFEFGRSNELLGHAFTVRIRTGNQNQKCFYPSVPHEISVLVELILGHLRYLLTDVPPQPNSPPDNVFRPDRPAHRALGQTRGAVPRFRFTE
ncbi:Regulator of rDNA transcription protein 15 [Capsicum baccatum]|uniref:Regulator of rDNA transcription protein 15 n=1 Tax=Capsicum baccatum TaxID=33114 RepID=A0A2G2UZK0_CAPBA|nr:Regulator of rDNA transcription protein 15 [Capsicum baccatum]